MKTKKPIVVMISFVLVGMFILLTGFEEKEKPKDKQSLQYVKSTFLSDIHALKEGKYKNLLCVNFNDSIEGIEGIYRLEILMDNSDESGTLIDSLKIREEVVDKFFEGDFDKSNLIAKVYLTETDLVEINYDDFEKEVSSERYKDALGLGTVIDNGESEKGYIVQVGYNRLHTWLSKAGLGTIHPSALGKYEMVIPYLMGDRQGENVKIQLKDREVLLSEVEENALAYMNSDKFPLIRADGISFVIGEARVIATNNYDGVCFLTRRVYKGVPFEYGSNVYTEAYNDEMGHDGGEISYVESGSPDTMLGFLRTDGTVVEEQEITEMLSVGDALSILSEKVGNNSVYEVHGVELVYRKCKIPKEKTMEISEILEPKWKIITINQNDDKYTLFYVDVISGEITNRFEYFYD